MRKLVSTLALFALPFGFAGCAESDQNTYAPSELTEADRTRLAEGYPAEDWGLFNDPKNIAGFSTIDAVCALESLDAPKLEGSRIGEFVPLHLHCKQGALGTKATVRLYPGGDSNDAILRLEKGQRLLVSLMKPYEDLDGNMALDVFNLYQVDDDGTMRILDAAGTEVGNLKDFRVAFELD